ncbi:MAG: hypothetical protein ACMUIP_06160 [bacterium]
MDSHGIQEKVTTKTMRTEQEFSKEIIHGYISKGVLIEKKDGNNVILVSDSNNALEKPIEHFKTETIFVERERYDNLLLELGALQERCKYLIDYKNCRDNVQEELLKTREQLNETNKWIEEIGQENKNLKQEKKVLKFQTLEKDLEIKMLKENLNELSKALPRIKIKKKKKGLIQKIFKSL